MANLRKKVPAFDLTRRKIVSGGDAMNNNDGQLDNRPTIPKARIKLATLFASFVGTTGGEMKCWLFCSGGWQKEQIYRVRFGI